MVQTSNDGSTGEERARRRAAVRRKEILTAAAKVFRRKGFAEAGMRDIAALAELSPGNLYHYFSGKHEILFFCQTSWLDHMIAHLRSLSKEQDIASQVGDVLNEHILSLLEDWEGSIAHLEVDGLPADLRDNLMQRRDEYERGLRRLIERGMRSGAFQAGDSVLITRAILGALNWTARWFKPEGHQSAAELAAEYQQFLLRGLQSAANGRNGSHS